MRSTSAIIEERIRRRVKRSTVYTPVNSERRGASGFESLDLTLQDAIKNYLESQPGSIMPDYEFQANLIAFDPTGTDLSPFSVNVDLALKELDARAGGGTLDAGIVVDKPGSFKIDSMTITGSDVRPLISVTSSYEFL